MTTNRLRNEKIHENDDRDSDDESSRNTNCEKCCFKVSKISVTQDCIFEDTLQNYRKMLRKIETELSDKDLMIAMLKEQHKIMENYCQNSLTETQKIKTRYLSALQELENMKKKYDTIESEKNEKHQVILKDEIERLNKENKEISNKIQLIDLDIQKLIELISNRRNGATSQHKYFEPFIEKIEKMSVLLSRLAMKIESNSRTINSTQTDFSVKFNELLDKTDKSLHNLMKEIEAMKDLPRKTEERILHLIEERSKEANKVEKLAPQYIDQKPSKSVRSSTSTQFKESEIVVIQPQIENQGEYYITYDESNKSELTEQGEFACICLPGTKKEIENEAISEQITKDTGTASKLITPNEPINKQVVIESITSEQISTYSETASKLITPEESTNKQMVLRENKALIETGIQTDSNALEPNKKIFDKLDQIYTIVQKENALVDNLQKKVENDLQKLRMDFIQTANNNQESDCCMDDSLNLLRRCNVGDCYQNVMCLCWVINNNMLLIIGLFAHVPGLLVR